MTRNTAFLALFALAVAASVACASGPAPQAAPQPTPQTDEQKTLYALGQAISMRLGEFSLSEDDLQYVQAGLADGVLGREPQVSLKEFGPKLQELAQARTKALLEKTKKEGAAFLEQQAKEPGAQRTDSGLIYFEKEAGTGAVPGPEDSVTVQYHGTLPNGKVFDSSIEKGKPATFSLNGVIPCFSEGIRKMKVGGKARLVCPPELAYGDRGAPPRIPPGSPLVFDLELLSSTPPKPKASKAPAAGKTPTQK